MKRSGIGHYNLVGFCGRAGSGKDAAASFLVGIQGFTKIAFADALKEAACAITGWRRDALELPGYKEGTDKVFGFTPRHFLQQLGTEVGRNIDTDLWVKAWGMRQRACKTPVVVTDVRFPNEAAAIHQAGGILVLIHRREAEAKPVLHASEALFDKLGHDVRLSNNGSLEELGSLLEGDDL
jgi:hypothetical protein